MTILANRVPLALSITRGGIKQSRTVAAIPTNTPNLYVAWSSIFGSYAIVHGSGLTVAYGWDRADHALGAIEDYLIGEAFDWTSAPEVLRDAPYQAVLDLSVAIAQHGGTFVHSLA